MDKYDQKLKEINYRLEQLQTNHQDATNKLGINTSSSFSRRILDEPIPSSFKIPQVEPYDDSSDPLDHLESYKALILLQRVSNALLCVAFLITLRKTVRAWYSGVQSESINSFKQFE